MLVRAGPTRTCVHGLAIVETNQANDEDYPISANPDDDRRHRPFRGA